MIIMLETGDENGAQYRKIVAIKHAKISAAIIQQASKLEVFLKCKKQRTFLIDKIELYFVTIEGLKSLQFTEITIQSKGVGRNFSMGGLSGAPFLNFQGGAQPRFLVASMVKMKEFSGQGVVMAPLPMPAYALAKRRKFVKLFTFCSRQIDGTFPSYADVISKSLFAKTINCIGVTRGG